MANVLQRMQYDIAVKKGTQCQNKRVSKIASENTLDTAYLKMVDSEQCAAWTTTAKLNSSPTTFKLQGDIAKDQVSTALNNKEDTLWPIMATPEDPWTIQGQNLSHR